MLYYVAETEYELFWMGNYILFYHVLLLPVNKESFELFMFNISSSNN